MFKTPAEKISSYLKENGITQAYVSRKTGIKPNTLNAILRGKTSLDADRLELICGALNCTPNDFLEPRLPNGGNSHENIS